MFGKTWAISESKYKVIVERDVKVKMSDGIELNADIFRPDSDEKFPAIFGFHPYDQVSQTAPMKISSFSTNFFKHPGQDKGNAYIEAGNPEAFVRRGYVYLIANVRGTGKSGGEYPFLAPPEAQDGYEVIEWIARQPWCTGHVGMFGVSYFAWIQLYIAALNPPHLTCLFAPWAATDVYRDLACRGGILGHGFLRMWALGSIDNGRVKKTSYRQEEIDKVLQDEDIAAIPELVHVLKNPNIGTHPLLVDMLLHPFDGPYWDQRKVKYESIKIPSYIGACWGVYGLHLPGAFRSWENLKVPKKMIIGPPTYLDRPLYQLQYESLRWFDYWMKGIDTGIMEEAPIKLFIMGTNEWKEAKEWPLPETKWTPFYLHENGLLQERVCHSNEGCDSFEDSPWGRGFLEYSSPRLVENTEVIGPMILNLHASTTGREVFWFISLREVDSQGKERVLTRGWLRGTHREVDPTRSKPWEPFHPHTKSSPLNPGEIYEFKIPIVPTGNLFKAGSRIKLKISCSDDQPKNPLEMIASGNLHRQSPSRITVVHDEDHPSCLLLPITRGNILETFLSEGKPYL
jgi:predicted acyl esterase